MVKNDLGVLIVILFFSVSLVFGQPVDYKVQKNVYPSFKNDTIISKERYYTGIHLAYEKKYAYNGWQVIDSLAYNHDLCFKVYEPNYDTKKKIIKNYFYSYDDCSTIDYYIEGVLLFRDEFMILRDYYSDIQFVFLNDYNKLKESDNCYIYEFRKPSPPALFSNFGIPNTEKLISLTLKLKQNLVLEDEFDYRNFNLKRTYYYDRDKLQKVQYVFWDRKNQKQKIFYDVYKYFNILNH